jgi:hypothetical protein
MTFPGAGPTPLAAPDEAAFYAASLPAFLARPDLPLSSLDFSGGRHYGAFLFAEFLESRRGGPGVIRQVWEEIRTGGDAHGALARVLGEDLASTLHDFHVATYLLAAGEAAVPRRWTFGDEVAVAGWRQLAAAQAAQAAAASGERLEIEPGGPEQGGVHYLGLGGAAFAELTWPAGVAGELRIAMRSPTRGTLLVFGRAPGRLCAVRELAPYRGAQVAVGAECLRAVLVLSNPSLATDATAAWSAQLLPATASRLGETP